MATGGAAALSGVSADTFGYVGRFSLATALAFASVVIVLKLFPGLKEAVSHTGPDDVGAGGAQKP